MLSRITIAVTEDRLREKLSKLLKSPDTVVESLADHRRFWKKISRIICDILIMSSDLIRDKTLDEIQTLQKLPDAPLIVVLSEETDDRQNAQLISAGCDTILNPTLSNRKLGGAFNAILNRQRKASRPKLAVRPKLAEADIGDFVAESTTMKKFVKILPRIAKSGSSVLILGETGVGKERLAHALHAESPRAPGPFIAVHCGALPESLLESELFGHEQGAFTGATKARRGCFELAHQGTIFLDEIGEMPIHLQSKLLRVLESREIHRIGSEKAITVDVRIMAATNRDLEAEVRAKLFRRDLYYRLNVVSLMVPPLRERLKDIPQLVYSYIDYLGPRIGCDVSDITDEALKSLCSYSWPGNVRELINVIERAMLLCEGDFITINDLPDSITGPKEVSLGELTHNPAALPEEWLRKPLKDARKDILVRFERSYLTTLLTSTKGRVGEAAKKAGIDSKSLYDKMKKYGLNKKDFRP
ncbi:MAG TPA: sigma-54-dependent Fis family transcriptional regulator [Planctomycetes bacterium]|nr:sigma-54-dependent Fis family transcriptional regulator [Planctomycetota bacterium]